MKKLLCLYYLGGAGGKFILNCLAHGGQVTFQNYQIASQYAKNKDLTPIKQASLATVPPKIHGHDWYQYEQGDYQLFGNDYPQLNGNYQDNDLTTFHKIDQWIPTTAHCLPQYNDVQNFFVDYQIVNVCIIPTQDFIDQSIRLKWPDTGACLCLDTWKNWNYTLDDLSFDYIIQDWDAREHKSIKKIQKLADFLAVDFSVQDCMPYIQKYREFYG